MADASSNVGPAYYIERGVERIYNNSVARDIQFNVRFNEIWADRRIGDLLMG